MARYECREPPCVHVVHDPARRVLAVFLETADGEYIYIPLREFSRACNEASRLLQAGFREAVGREVDRLAEEYLGAVPVEEGEE